MKGRALVLVAFAMPACDPPAAPRPAPAPSVESVEPDGPPRFGPDEGIWLPDSGGDARFMEKEHLRSVLRYVGRPGEVTVVRNGRAETFLAVAHQVHYQWSGGRPAGAEVPASLHLFAWRGAYADELLHVLMPASPARFETPSLSGRERRSQPLDRASFFIEGRSRWWTSTAGSASIQPGTLGDPCRTADPEPNGAGVASVRCEEAMFDVAVDAVDRTFDPHAPDDSTSETSAMWGRWSDDARHIVIASASVPGVRFTVQCDAAEQAWGYVAGPR